MTLTHNKTLTAPGVFSMFGTTRFGSRVCFSPETGEGADPNKETNQADDADPKETSDGDKTDDKSKTDEAAKETKTDDSQSDKDVKVSNGEAKLLREVMEKKEKINELSSELAKAQEGLKRFEGIDPDEVRKLISERADHEKTEAEKRGEFDRVKEMMAKEHKAEVERQQQQIEAMKTEYEGRVAEMEAALAQANTMINDLTVGSRFDTSRFITDETVLPASKARALYGAHFEVEEGKPVAYDKPRGAADRTKLVGGDGNPLDFETAIKKLVESDPDAERLVKSRMKTGAGSGTDADGKAKERSTVGAGVNRIQVGLASRSGQKK